MSIIINTAIKCNDCGREDKVELGPELDINPLHIRAIAWHDGWREAKGRDICPDCIAGYEQTSYYGMVTYTRREDTSYG